MEEWMIYRFVVCSLVGSVGLLLLLATALANQMAHFGPRRHEANFFWAAFLASVMQGPVLVAVETGLAFGSLWCLWPGIIEYLTHGTVSLHWSRLLAGAFGLLCISQTLVFALLLKVLQIWRFNEQELPEEIGSSVSEPLLQTFPVGTAGALSGSMEYETEH